MNTKESFFVPFFLFESNVISYHEKMKKMTDHVTRGSLDYVRVDSSTVITRFFLSFFFFFSVT